LLPPDRGFTLYQNLPLSLGAMSVCFIAWLLVLRFYEGILVVSKPNEKSCPSSLPSLSFFQQTSLLSPSAGFIECSPCCPPLRSLSVSIFQKIMSPQLLSLDIAFLSKVLFREFTVGKAASGLDRPSLPFSHPFLRILKFYLCVPCGQNSLTCS